MKDFMRTVKPHGYSVRLITTIFLTLFSIPALSHPLAQGAAVLNIDADRIVLELTISLEQVLVAGQWGQSAKPLDYAALERHGDYLLQHIEIRADENVLPGKVIAAPTQLKAPLTYQLAYAVAKDHAHPAHLLLKQNVLREIDFAPGNPWEVSYRLQAFNNGQPVAEALFSHQAPLQIELGGGFTGKLYSDYATLGLKHILNGYDHLLFVGGLVLAVGNLAELSLIILLFTVAHSLTMTLAVLDIVRLSPRLVEPLIAFSIVAVAGQNLFWPRQSRGLLRYFIVFGFGLFHGLGFAGGLIENIAEISSAQTAWIILSFSIGVECGHLLVVTPLYGILSWTKNTTVATWRTDTFRRFGSSLIGISGLFYTYFSITTPF